jgi:hypothetical protein
MVERKGKKKQFGLHFMVAGLIILGKLFEAD